METLPRATHLRGKCDVLIVDGGHSYDVAKADLHNFHQMANPERHLVIVDDVPQYKPVTAAWNRAKAAGVVRELFVCKMEPSRGFAVGMYNMTGYTHME